MTFTLFTSNCRGNEENCFYPQKVQVDSPDKLKAAVENDHVCATYRNCYRGKGNFIKSDVIPMDIDNDRTADPQLYITPEKLDELFPDSRVHRCRCVHPHEGEAPEGLSIL